MPFSHWYSIGNSNFDLSAETPNLSSFPKSKAHQHSSQNSFSPCIMQRMAALKVKNESAARKRQEASREAAQKQLKIRIQLQEKLTRAAGKAANKTFSSAQEKMKRSSSSASTSSSTAATEHEKRHLIADFIVNSGRRNGKRSKISSQIHPEVAASTIQRRWVRIRLSPSFFSFFLQTRSLHPISSSGSSISASQPSESNGHIQRLLMQKHLIETAFELLQRCFSLQVSKREAKILLSMFMFLNEEQSEMHEASLGLFRCFIQSLMNVECLPSFCEQFVEFKDKFTAWSEQDRRKLVEEIHGFQHDLEALRQTVEGQADYESDWKPKIQRQQQQIASKLRLLGEQSGEDSESLNESTRDSTRTANQQSQAQNEQSQLILDSAQSTHDSQKVHDSAQSTHDSQKVHDSQSNLDQTQTTQQSQKTHESAQSTQQSQSNSSTLKPPSQNPLLFGAISKQQILHEIFMQENFQIQDLILASCSPQGQYSSFEALMIDQSQKLHEWIEKPDFSLLEAISYLSQRLLELAPQRPSARAIRQEIQEFFDLPHIAQQIERSIFNLQAMVIFSCKIMAKLCAPIRDEEISKLLQTATNAQNTTLSDLLVRLIQLIDAMTFDMINFFTQTIRAHVTYNIVEYERAACNNQISLADQEVISACKSKHPDQASDTKFIISQIYCDILKSPPIQTVSLQSLAFDQRRIQAIRSAIHNLSVEGAIRIILKSQLGIDVGDYQNFSTLISRQTSNPEIQTKLIQACERIRQGKDGLYELFKSRLVDACRKQFIYGRYSLVNTGLEPVEAKVKEELVNPFMRVFDTNWRIYSEAYSREE